MLFANACIYLHKITTEDQNPSYYYKKLRDMPIFEYLKANNFLMLDKFLLNANSSLKPPSIIFWTIVGIVLGSLILLGIHYWFLSKNSELLEYNKNIKIEEFIIICLPYLFIAIIAILFNTFQLQNIGGLKEIKKKFDDTVESNIISFTAIKAKNTKEDLQNIKKVLQKYIYNTNLTFTIGDFDKYKDDSDNGINIDVGAIFDIYKRNTTKKKEKDKPFYDKQFQRKYMNYIDEYFDLLKYNKDNKIEDDYYTDLYLLGIIYYDEMNDEDNAYIYQKTRYELKEVLRQIKSNMKAYFGTIIGLYVVMCIGILVYFVVSDNTTKMVIVSLATISNGIALLLGIGSLAFLYFAVL